MISSKKILHLGKTNTNYFPTWDVDYNPIIASHSIPLKKENLSILPNVTHMVITSKETVIHFLKPYKQKFYEKLKILSIGPFTTSALKKENFNVFCQANDYSQEGIIELFENIKDKNMHIGLPRSASARTNLDDYLNQKKIPYSIFSCYDTVFNKNFSKVNLDEFQGIFFTSPSCVWFFFEIYALIPAHITLYAIGSITESALISKRKEFKLLNNILKIKH